MSHQLIDFKVDESSQTVVITKDFPIDISKVWDAFTTPELLDQWWAPKPWTSKTKYMNFQEGGSRFYAMVSPEGHENWQIQEYIAINPQSHFKYFSVFADQDENRQLPGSYWDLNFSEQGGVTRLRISIHNESLERMLKMIEMGFKEGISMTLNELEQILLLKN